MEYDVKDLALAEEGRLKIEWASFQMPVLAKIKEDFEKRKPLKGVTIGACLHVTTETANLVITLKAAGAKVSLCASNPLSTQDEVAASLVKDFDISVFAKRGEDKDTYYKHIKEVLSRRPLITMDDGADLVATIHSERKDLLKEILGGTEETTTGVIRLRGLQRQNLLGYPIIAVNDAKTKHFFDNRYGTGQSTIDGIIRATNILLAGRTVIVCGYGWCGKGVSMRAKGMGAKVVISEVDPIKALEAAMDGFNIMKLKDASKVGDVFITVTGNSKVLTKEHFQLMKDGAIIANSGHFNVEIDIESLEKLSIKKRLIRPGVEEYTLQDGRRLNLLAEGRLVNLACAEGHPAQVMDMSFANQALVCEYIMNKGSSLEKKVYPVPDDLDEKVARLKLKTMGIEIDELTQHQKDYLSSWDIGT
jgi:adenosylhomocysteinase